jgi:hypothetical protein
MGKSGDELKARRFTHGTVRSLIASTIVHTIIQRLQLQIVRSHADAKFLMQHLDFVVVVVLSICRHFRHFGIYRWLSRAPGCKVLMKHCYSGYAWTFETSCLMNVSFFHISVYTVLEQLGIGGSSRVVAIIG